jgi:guanine deaminase
MAEAIRLAAENIHAGGGPFAALVVHDGHIIARGTNRVTASNDPTAHAEVAAIREACRILGSFQLTGCEVYTTCEPCPMCLGAIYWARPSAVYYACTKEDAAAAGFDDSFIYDEIRCVPAERRIPMTQALRAEARQIFEEWKTTGGRVEY